MKHDAEQTRVCSVTHETVTDGNKSMEWFVNPEGKFVELQHSGQIKCTHKLG